MNKDNQTLLLKLQQLVRYNKEYPPINNKIPNDDKFGDTLEQLVRVIIFNKITKNIKSDETYIWDFFLECGKTTKQQGKLHMQNYINFVNAMPPNIMLEKAFVRADAVLRLFFQNGKIDELMTYIDNDDALDRFFESDAFLNYKPNRIQLQNLLNEFANIKIDVDPLYDPTKKVMKVSNFIVEEEVKPKRPNEMELIHIEKADDDNNVGELFQIVPVQTQNVQVEQANTEVEPMKEIINQQVSVQQIEQIQSQKKDETLCEKIENNSINKINDQVPVIILQNLDELDIEEQSDKVVTFVEPIKENIDLEQAINEGSQEEKSTHKILDISESSDDTKETQHQKTIEIVDSSTMQKQDSEDEILYYQHINYYQASQNYELALFSNRIKAQTQQYIGKNERIIKSLMFTETFDQNKSLKPVEFSSIRFNKVYFTDPDQQQEAKELLIQEGENLYEFNSQIQFRKFCLEDLIIDRVNEKTPLEEQVQSQQGQCPCGQLFEPNEFLWQDKYNGQYYCNNCSKEIMIIPCDILINKRQESIVSQQSKQLIESMNKLPCILNEMIPFVLNKDQVFKTLLQLRKKIVITYKLLNMCSKVDIRYGEFGTYFKRFFDIVEQKRSIDPDDLQPISMMGDFGYMAVHEAAVLFLNKSTGQYVCQSPGYWRLCDIDEDKIPKIVGMMYRALIKISQHTNTCDQCMKTMVAWCVCGQKVVLTDINTLICDNCGCWSCSNCAKCKVCRK